MSKVAVLIAVYNTANYLRECLDSVCAQTFEDIQIICIDDCSTDGSLDILQEYAQADSRVCVIPMKENRGQAIARNEGLRIASGEYVMMLDSDDWLAPDAIEQAYRAVTAEEDIDCALFALTYYHESEGRFEPYCNRTSKRSFTGEEAFELSLDWSLHGVYMVRASIHHEYPYDTSCRLYSDDNTTRSHFLHSRKVVLSQGIYYYRRHEASMTTRLSILRFDYMDANLSMKRTLQQEVDKGTITHPTAILNKYETHRWLNIVDAYWLYYTYRDTFTPTERKEIEERIARMLGTVERKRIPLSLRVKLGYYPFRSYRLFALVENFYFTLRKWLGK